MEWQTLTMGMSSNRVRLVTAIRALTAVVLFVAAIAKLATFGATTRYLEASFHVAGVPYAAFAAAAVLLVALEFGLAIGLVAKASRGFLVASGWLFLGFCGWHVAGLAVGAPSCPCLGRVTAAMNATANQIVMAVVSAILGGALVTAAASWNKGDIR